MRLRSCQKQGKIATVGQLSQSYLAAWIASRTQPVRPPTKEELELCELRLQKIVADARSSWPGVDVGAEELTRYLVERLAPDQGFAEGLEALKASDLYLACACSRGDPRALACFDRQFIMQVPAYIAETNAQKTVVDDVKQLLRDELLVGRVGAAPLITKYRGHGALGGWVRLIALRTVRDLLRGAHRNIPFGEEHEFDLEAADPELQYLKTRYSGQVNQAFRSTLAGLPPNDRNLLSQYYLDGLSTDAIARLYRVDGSTIRRRLARLRQAILDETHRLLAVELGLDPSQAESLLALVRSRIEVSVRTHLLPR